MTAKQEPDMPGVISVVAFQENGLWIAQCLEYDIVAQSKTLKELPYKFSLAFVSHLAVRAAAEQEPFAGVGRAPARFWKLYDKAMPLADPVRVPVTVGGHRSGKREKRALAPTAPGLEMRIAA